MANREELIRQLRAEFHDVGADFNERQRRHWAAAAALRLGRGGITVVSKALCISPNTIKKGIAELAELATTDNDADSAEVSRIRRAGGGRKPRH